MANVSDMKELIQQANGEMSMLRSDIRCEKTAYDSSPGYGKLVENVLSEEMQCCLKALYHLDIIARADNVLGTISDVEGVLKDIFCA